jgi:LuxR family transcriptional regulator, maltose regulon positive regulatory protein
MARRASKKTPLVVSGYLYTDDPLTTGLVLDSPAWFVWLEAGATASFYYQGAVGGLTVRRERKQRGGWYWVAYHSSQGKLHKIYLGPAHAVTRAALETALVRLMASPIQPTQAAPCSTTSEDS